MSIVIKYFSILFFIIQFESSATIAPKAINIDLQTELVLDKKNNTSFLHTLDKLLNMITVIENEVMSTSTVDEKNKKQWNFIGKINTNEKLKKYRHIPYHERHGDRRPFDDNLSDILEDIKPNVSKEHPFSDFVLRLLKEYALKTEGSQILLIQGGVLLELIQSNAYRSRIETFGKDFVNFLEDYLSYMYKTDSIHTETYEQSLQPPHERRERFNEHFNKILNLVDAKFDKNDTKNVEIALKYLKNTVNAKTFVKYVVEHVILEPFFKFSTLDRKYIRTRLAYLAQLARDKGLIPKDDEKLLLETTEIIPSDYLRKKHRVPIYRWNIKSNQDNQELKKERKVKLKKHGSNLIIKRRFDDLKTEINNKHNIEMRNSSSLESKKDEIMNNFTKIKEDLENETLRSNAQIKLQRIDEHWNRIRYLLQKCVKKLME